MRRRLLAPFEVEIYRFLIDPGDASRVGICKAGWVEGFVTLIWSNPHQRHIMLSRTLVVRKSTKRQLQIAKSILQLPITKYDAYHEMFCDVASSGNIDGIVVMRERTYAHYINIAIWRVTVRDDPRMMLLLIKLLHGNVNLENIKRNAIVEGAKKCQRLFERKRDWTEFTDVLPELEDVSPK